MDFINSIEEQIAKAVKLSRFSDGLQTIRNEKGWRENELDVEYCYLINLARSFIGFGGLFSIKLNHSKYRLTENPEALIQGIYTLENEKVKEIYFEKNLSNFEDKLNSTIELDIFNSKKGLTIDGDSFIYSIHSNQLKAIISFSNPNQENWNKWLDSFFITGNEIAIKSNIKPLIELFK